MDQNGNPADENPLYEELNNDNINGGEAIDQHDTFKCVQYCENLVRIFSDIHGLVSHNDHRHRTFKDRCTLCHNSQHIPKPDLEQHYNEHHSQKPKHKKPKKTLKKGGYRAPKKRGTEEKVNWGLTTRQFRVVRTGEESELGH